MQDGKMLLARLFAAASLGACFRRNQELQLRCVARRRVLKK